MVKAAAQQWNPDGFELWSGPSAIDGVRIGVVVNSLRKAPLNEKLGDMAQAWILPYETPPNTAAQTGQDISVCGDCRFRRQNEGGCYVHIPSTAQRVWWAWRVFGSYVPHTIPEAIRGKALGRSPVRLGAWGDPGMVPVHVWRDLIDVVPGWTCYTHQWRDLDPGAWSFSMASVDSEAEALEAQALGWRTYRARMPGDDCLPSEIGCPAADEAPARRDGTKPTCSSCGLCRGSIAGRNGQAKSISIEIHGQAIRRAAAALEAADVDR
jgi:hypothetical protein